MSDSSIIDRERFGWGGKGTDFVTVGVEIPLSGVVQIGIAWNEDQWGIISSGGLNPALPVLLKELGEGVFESGSAGVAAWEVLEAFYTISAVRNGQWTNLVALNGGKINGYVEDLGGTVSTVGFQLGVIGANVIIPEHTEGGVERWFHETPGAGWEYVISTGFRLNSFLETTEVLYLSGPTRAELEIRVLEGLSDSKLGAFPPPTEIWDSIIAPCFSAGTPILLSDGTTRAIEDIRPGDKVAAFAEGEAQGRGALRAGDVVRLIPGVTTEWIVLDDTSSARLRQDTRVTPGHPYLTEHGDWMAASELVNSEVRAVAADDTSSARLRQDTLVQLRGSVLRAADAGVLPEAGAGEPATWITPEPCAAGNLQVPENIYAERVQ